MIPAKIFFTKGVGRHTKELQSFEFALRDAGVAFLNLVAVSSILPPHCEEITKEEGLKLVSPGEITFVVIARQTSDEKNRRVNAGIGVAKPKNQDHYGYLSELHCFGKSQAEVEDEVEDLAASMLASTLGIPFNVDAAWDEKRQTFKMSDLIVETKSSVSSAVVEKDKEFTTVVSLAVFIPPKP